MPRKRKFTKFYLHGGKRPCAGRNRNNINTVWTGISTPLEVKKHLYYLKDDKSLPEFLKELLWYYKRAKKREAIYQKHREKHKKEEN